MSRFLVPLIFFAAAGFVWHYNGTHENGYLLLPFLEVVPDFAGDYEAQAAWSWRVIAGIGVTDLVLSIIRDIRNRCRRASISSRSRFGHSEISAVERAEDC